MHPRPRLPTLFVALLFLSGCMVAERNVDDTDGDLLLDSFEEQGWNITVHRQFAPCFQEDAQPPPETAHVTSNPFERDTDFDGLHDGDEYAWNAHPRHRDTDGDGLDDLYEVQLATGARQFEPALVFPAILKPSHADSDQDCLSDGDELRGFDIPGIGHRTTDPTTSDTDSDGLSDAHEVRVSLTDPRNADTDGDGAPDSADLDPLYDLWIKIRVMSFHLLQGSGDESVVLSFSLEDGVYHSEPFTVTGGSNSSVPATRSPGSSDFNDGTYGQPLQFQVWARNGNTGAFYNLTPASSDTIATVWVEVRDARWSWGGETGSGNGRATGPTDGGWGVVETAQVRLGVRIQVERR
jgi:hypothetical protein